MGINEHLQFVDEHSSSKVFIKDTKMCNLFHISAAEQDTAGRVDTKRNKSLVLCV